MSAPALLDSPARKLADPAVCIRRMTSPEAAIAVDWAAQEGWNPGINEADVFYRADPEGFFVALHDGDPIGCCSAVVYEPDYAFFGLFIVRPEFRKRGIGLELTRVAMEHVGRRNCGLDGVPVMQAKYADFGFRPAYRNIRFEGSCDGKWHEDVVSLEEVPFDELEEYDFRHFAARRGVFLRGWISQPGSAALGYLLDGRLTGYGVVRPCHVGYKIGPLFADSEEVADVLFQSLCMHTHGASVFLDTPEPNDAAVTLAQRYGMRPCFETARMYTKSVPDFPIDHVFGVTTFELG